MIVTIFRSSVQARVVINWINCARTKILSRAPCGSQNAIEGQGKDLATHGAAIGLVCFSTYSPSLKVNLLVVYHLARGGSS